MSNVNEKVITIKPNTSVVVGFYIQDFDNLTMTDSEGKESTISLHRVLLQVIDNINPDRWGVQKGDFGGSGVSELKIPLGGISYIFGYAPDDPAFNLVDTLKKLCYKSVRFDYGIDNKGRAKLRSIYAVD